MLDRQKSSCAEEAGALVPIIDRNRCEAKEDCVRVCPYDVFEIRILGPAERTALSLGGRVKAFFHGYRQAFAVRAQQCHSCGLCVQACPEHAIKLRSVGCDAEAHEAQGATRRARGASLLSLGTYSDVF